MSRQVEMPQDLIDKFEQSSFCPNDFFRGRPETGTDWNTLEIEYNPGGESEYPGTLMYYVHNCNGKITKATRAWGEMSGRYDGIFIKAVVDWFQSMTQAKESEADDEPEGGE
jgi:superfamily I DNA and RNA helicase